MARTFFTIIMFCILNMASGWCRTEYLYPMTPDDITYSAWTSTGANKWSVIDDPQGSPDDTDYVKTATSNNTNDGSIQDFVGSGGNDVINYVTFYYRGQESGGETLRAGVYNGSLTSTQDLIAASWTTTSKQMNLSLEVTAWTAAAVNALRWYGKAIVVGKDTSIEWRISQFYLEVNYDAYSIEEQFTTVTDFTGQYSLGHPLLSTYQDKVAMSFQLSNARDITKVEMYCVDYNPGTITARIETDSGGHPSGTLANANAYGTFTPPPPIAGWGYANLTGASRLNANTTYWLVLSLAVDPGESNHLELRGDLDNTYANGHYEYHPDGGSWTDEIAIVDAAFKIEWTPGIGGMQVMVIN